MEKYHASAESAYQIAHRFNVHPLSDEWDTLTKEGWFDLTGLYKTYAGENDELIEWLARLQE